MSTRNQVMLAVGELINSITFSPTPIMGQTTWVTPPLVGGKIQPLKLWADVPVDLRPACYLVTHREVDDYTGVGPLYRRRLELLMYCYSVGGINYGGSALADLDNMMQGFESVFNVPDNPSQGTNTLGGLVYWCRIQGKVFKDPGDIDGDAMLICPVIVEMP